MKPIINFALILLTVSLFSCADREPIVGPSSMHRPSSSINKIQSINYCANNIFPSATDNMNQMMNLKISNDGTEIEISALQATFYWSRYVQSPNENQLLVEYLSRSPRTKIPNLISIPNGIHPKLQWDFVKSHSILIQRTIGSSSTSFTLNNNPTATLSFEDNSIDLSTISANVVYEVYYQNFGETDEIPATITYTIPPTVSISGVTEVSIPAKYSPAISVTWVANVSNGSYPYTYQWYQGGNLVGTSQTLTKSYRYIGYNIDGNMSLSLVIHDSDGRTTSAAINVFEDSYPYNP